ncbi:MAG: DUF4147 domain-containing protein, partial [Ferroplasma sp.]
MHIVNYDEIAISKKRIIATGLIESAINTMDPEKAISKAFNLNLSDYGHIYAIGFGKASYGMYSGIREKILGNLSYAGIIVPEDESHQNEFPELSIYKGTHPLISNESVESSRKLISHLNNLKEGDLVIVLISGGGSSLFEIPEDGIDANDIMKISKEIMNNDGDIFVLNHIRSCLSSVKNGKLAKMLYPATVVSYIISDVIYNDLNVIASGPLAMPQYD